MQSGRQVVESIVEDWVPFDLALLVDGIAHERRPDLDAGPPVGVDLIHGDVALFMEVGQIEEEVADAMHLH